MSERDADDPVKKYGPALNAALDRAGDRIEEIHREIEAAAGLLEELTAMPEEKRSERIRTEVRFHALKLCDLLLKRSRDSWFRDPSRAVKLARLAVEIAGWLDVGHYGEALVEEERALAWAYLGNAHRIASDLRSAEEALLRAEEHYKSGGEDALTGPRSSASWHRYGLRKGGLAKRRSSSIVPLPCTEKRVTGIWKARL